MVGPLAFLNLGQCPNMEFSDDVRPLSDGLHPPEILLSESL